MHQNASWVFYSQINKNCIKFLDFTSFFIFLHKKCWKSSFQPTLVLLITQTLAKIFNTQTEKNRQHKSWAEEQTDAHTNRKQFKNCKEVPLSFFATKNKISFSNEAIYLWKINTKTTILELKSWLPCIRRKTLFGLKYITSLQSTLN